MSRSGRARRPSKHSNVSSQFVGATLAVALAGSRKAMPLLRTIEKILRIGLAFPLKECHKT